EAGDDVVGGAEDEVARAFQAQRVRQDAPANVLNDAAGAGRERYRAARRGHNIGLEADLVSPQDADIARRRRDVGRNDGVGAAAERRSKLGTTRGAGWFFKSTAPATVIVPDCSLPICSTAAPTKSNSASENVSRAGSSGVVPSRIPRPAVRCCNTTQLVATTWF